MQIGEEETNITIHNADRIEKETNITIHNADRRGGDKYNSTQLR
jgi:hypothetical protein